MPEIAEVARIVHFLRLHLVGKTIQKVQAPDDSNVFGKAGTSGDEFVAGLKDKKVVSAGSQGKYFWLVLDKPPHPVMHFGMTGWVHIKGIKTAYTNYYKKMKPGEEDQWPPKYWKFQLETAESPKVEVAFTDPRRFGRIRLVDCPGDSIRKFSPLVENGPDPVVDPDIFTEEFLRTKMHSRHVPIKALLLDQAFISGIGNWVGDEVLYQAQLHPEQYSDDFNDEQIKKLYQMIRHVCQTAVDKLGDSDQFPEDWLFNHRWGKGSQGSGSKLPNGEKLAFLTVGGRTSCYAPNLQKKSGRVAPGVKEEPLVPADEKPAASKVAGSGSQKQPSRKKKQAEKKAEPAEERPRPSKRKMETPKGEEASSTKKSRQSQPDPAVNENRRRSGRVKAK